jgi:hypothetical protein
MRVIDELVSTIQNELNNRCGDWEFDGRRVVNAYRKGKSRLVLELGDDAEITIRFKPNGSKKHCPVCEKTKGGWPHWWRNVAESYPNDDERRKGLTYACHDCVVDSRGHEGDSEASGPEEDVSRH